MTPTPPPVQTTVPGFVVLDPELPDRPATGARGDHAAALHVLSVVQEEFHGSSRPTARAATPSHLALATIDATDTIGTSFHVKTIIGMRPAQR